QGSMIELVIEGPAAPVLHAASEAAAKAQKQCVRVGTLLRTALRSEREQWDGWFAKNFPGRAEADAFKCISLASKPKDEQGMRARVSPDGKGGAFLAFPCGIEIHFEPPAAKQMTKLH